jgi:hypothetical protein
MRRQSPFTVSGSPEPARPVYGVATAGYPVVRDNRTALFSSITEEGKARLVLTDSGPLDSCALLAF